MRRHVAVVVVLLIALLLVAPAASPLRLGYVTSESMSPTLEPEDGYVAVPAGDVGPGDVVVYWSAIRGEYVTHRVVDVEERGFVTKGDANAATDQESGYPPVPRSAVVAEVLAVGGSPLVLPGLGTVVPTIQRYRAVVLGLIVLASIGLLVRLRRGWRDRRPARSVLRVRDVAEPIILVGLVTTVAVTPLGATSYQLTYVASEDASGEYTIPIDEPATRTVSIDAGETPLTRHVVRADGMTVVDRSTAGGTIELTASIPPPGAAGPQATTVRVYPYLDVLPTPLLERLHDVHPVAAIAGTAGALFGGLYLLYRLALDRDRPLFQARSHWAELFGGS